MKKNYVKHQHYIPQFALSSFQNSQGKIPYTIIGEKQLNIYYSTTNKLMQERDFYEFKTTTNNYIRRNFLEDDYAFFENELASNFNFFINLTSKPNFQEKFNEIIQNNKWGDIEATLLTYLFLLLIRGKDVKQIVYSKKQFPIEINHVMYLLATTSKLNAVRYAKEMFQGEELEYVLRFIKEEKNDNPLTNLAKHIMTNYQVRVCKVKGKKRFFLSDNPVIVQKFEGEDYILPLSPDICIILIPISLKDNKIEIDTSILYLEDANVDRINKHEVRNTKQQILISDEKDLDFINSIIRQKN